MAKRYGVGGESWSVTTPASGMGGSPVSAGTVTGRALQGRLGSAGASAPGKAVEDAAWYFVLFSGALAARQQVADGTYTFTVIGLAAPGVYEVERL